MELNQKRIVLTGSASGIGKALLTQLCAYNVQIVAADLDLTDVRHLPERRAQIYGVKCDVSQQKDMEQLFDYALETMGGIDIFIANAGFAYYEQIGEADWAHIEKIFQVNTISPFYAAIRMREINPKQPYMTVIIASAMSKLALPGYALYSGTKSALERFAEAYRYELPEGGHLTLVHPIATRTNFFDHQTHHAPVPFPSQTPEYVATQIIKGIGTDADTIQPSLIFRIFWMINRVLPFMGTIYKTIEAWRFRRWRKQSSNNHKGQRDNQETLTQTTQSPK